jgi:hypothetical protein
MPEDSDEPRPVTSVESARSVPVADASPRGLGVPGPLTFGVIAGTIEFAVVLWLLYC